MISAEEQRDRSGFGATFAIAFVDRSKGRYADSYLEMVSKNKAEYSLLALKFHGHISFACETLSEALRIAKEKNCSKLLFIEVGNISHLEDGVIRDVKEYVNENPNAKFIGHILQHQNGTFYIHPQFMLIDVEWAISNQVTEIMPEDSKRKWNTYKLERSNENFHDSYTPHWVAVGDKEKTQFKGQGLGWNIIHELARTNSEMLVWPKYIRKQKTFIYPTVKQEVTRTKGLVLDHTNYHRVYIANTEVIDKVKFDINESYEQVFTPCSGPLTFLLGYYAKATKLIAYDIEPLAISYIEDLKNNWDGYNYKEYVMDNILTSDALGAIYVGKGKPLDDADQFIKDLGQDFINWWEHNKHSIQGRLVNLYNQDTWHEFDLHATKDVKTYVNVSNIFHYEPLAITYGVAERVTMLTNFRTFLKDKISSDCFLFGMNPLNNSKSLNKKSDLNTIPTFPWSKV